MKSLNELAEEHVIRAQVEPYYRDDARHDFKCGYAARDSEIASLQKQVEELQTVKRLYHELCHEWTETCEDDCSSYGHSEGCKNVNIAEAKKALTSQLEEANLVIDFYEQGTAFETGQDYIDFTEGNCARDYLKKWGIK